MTEPVPRRKSTWLLIALAAVLLAAAFIVDDRVCAYFNDSAAQRFCARPVAERLMRLPGNWPLVLATVVALLLFHRRHWWPALVLVAADIIGGTIIAVLKGTFGRARPGKWPGTPEWVWFRGGWYGFFHQTNVGFASGDACQAFVWAEAVAVFVPRLRWPAYAFALVTAAQRVMVGAHHLSDVTAGAIVGVVTVRLLVRILSPIVSPATDGPGVEDLSE